jgi:hypothetical protein
MDFPEDIWKLMLSGLDFVCGLNVYSTCKTLYNLNDKRDLNELMDMLYISGYSNVLLLEEALRRICEKDEIFLLKKLLPLYSRSNIVDISVEAFENKGVNSGYFLYKRAIKTNVRGWERSRNALIKYALLNGNSNLINKVIKHDLYNLNLLVYFSAEIGNYEYFIKYYNFVRQVCFCCYLKIRIKKKNYILICSTKGTKIVDGVFTNKYCSSLIRENIKCDKCHFGEYIYRISILYIIDAAKRGKNKKIIDYLIEMGH